MSDDLGPTPEWMRKHAAQFDAPDQSRETARKVYRAIGRFGMLYKRGDIEQDQYEAACKLEKHYFGSLGHDVRHGSDGGGVSDVEFPRSYHSQMVAKCQAQVTGKEWIALVAVIEDRMTLEDIGQTLTTARKREITRARGLQLVAGGLERLSEHFGFAQRARERRRA